MGGSATDRQRGLGGGKSGLCGCGQCVCACGSKTSLSCVQTGKRDWGKARQESP